MERRAGPIIMVLVLSATIAAAVYLTMRGGGGPSRPALLVAVVGLAAAAAVVAVTIRSRRSRGTGLPATEAAASLGLAYTAAASHEIVDPWQPLPGIPRGGQVRHVLRGEIGMRPLLVFQHSYVISTGQTTVPVYHTVLITAAPSWPATTVSPRGFVGRVLRTAGIRRGLELEDDAFNAAFRVKADDEDFAIALLSPPMQQLMLEHRSIVWHAHDGCVAMVYGGGLKFDRLATSLDRFARFWTLVPEEMASLT